jgi:tetratricopeptide (TPR) repeat protein
VVPAPSSRGEVGRGLPVAGVLLALSLTSASLFAHPSGQELLEVLDEELAEAPNDPSLYLERGLLWLDLGQPERARRDIDRAAALEPGLAAVDLARARWELAVGSPRRAEEALGRCLDRHPDHVTCLLLRAEAKEREGDPEGAAAAYRRAIAVLPQPGPDLYGARARLLVAASRPDEALEVLDEGVQRLGPVPSLLAEAVDLAEATGKRQVALERVGELLDAGADPATWEARRGAILAGAGRTSEARRAYLRALAALERRPAGRRSTRALMDLEEGIRSALSRLGSDPSRGDERLDRKEDLR